MIHENDLRGALKAKGIAPLMGVSEGIGPSAAVQKSTGESATAENAETGPAEEPSVEPAVAPSRFERTRSEDTGGGDGWRSVAILLATAGLALGVAPHVSGAAAEWLHTAGDLQLQAGALLVAALVALAFGRLGGRLAVIRRSIQDVESDTARIEQIAASGHTLSSSLD